MLMKMDTTEWLMLIQTAAVVATGVVVVWYTWETRHLRKISARQADAAVLKQAYDYVIETYPSRKRVFEDAPLIRAVTTCGELRDFKVAHPETDRAIHDVANCFHYVGFLMEHGLFSDDRPFLLEGGHTVLRAYEILWPYILLERQDAGAPRYKQYFHRLAERARALEDAPARPGVQPAPGPDPQAGQSTRTEPARP
jgi:hypothetical protein